MEMLIWILVIITCLGMVIFLAWVYFKEGYEKGQIDALNQKQHYHLVEFKDGERKYYHEKSLKDLVDHKLIK